jgi:hypothetical protein
VNRRVAPHQLRPFALGGLALLHAEEEALALRTQLEKRLDAANAQVAAALVDVAGLVIYFVVAKLLLSGTLL